MTTAPRGRRPSGPSAYDRPAARTAIARPARTMTVRLARPATVRLVRTTTVRHVRTTVPLRPPGRRARTRPPRPFVLRPPRPLAQRPPEPRRAAGGANRLDWTRALSAPRRRSSTSTSSTSACRPRRSSRNVSEVTFGALGLSDDIVRTLADLGAATPFPIQPRRSPRSSRARTCSRAVAPAPERPSPSAPRSSRACCAPRPGAPRSPRPQGPHPRARRASSRCRSTACRADRPQRRPVHDADHGGVRRAVMVRVRSGRRHIIGTPGRIEDLIDRASSTCPSQHRRDRRG